jgi:hypothetical protein
MYVCIYMYIHTYIYICGAVKDRIKLDELSGVLGEFKSLFIYVYKSIYMSSRYVNVYIYIYMYVCIYMYVYTCIYINIYTYVRL